jgi:hypothetical protein
MLTDFSEEKLEKIKLFQKIPYKAMNDKGNAPIWD